MFRQGLPTFSLGCHFAPLSCHFWTAESALEYCLSPPCCFYWHFSLRHSKSMSKNSPTCDTNKASQFLKCHAHSKNVMNSWLMRPALVMPQILKQQQDIALAFRKLVCRHNCPPSKAFCPPVPKADILGGAIEMLHYLYLAGNVHSTIKSAVPSNRPPCAGRCFLRKELHFSAFSAMRLKFTSIQLQFW